MRYHAFDKTEIIRLVEQSPGRRGRAETILLERERIKQSQIDACNANCAPHNLNHL
jgi:hypothetical protein